MLYECLTLVVSLLGNITSLHILYKFITSIRNVKPLWVCKIDKMYFNKSSNSCVKHLLTRRKYNIDAL